MTEDIKIIFPCSEEDKLWLLKSFEQVNKPFSVVFFLNIKYSETDIDKVRIPKGFYVRDMQGNWYVFPHEWNSPRKTVARGYGFYFIESQSINQVTRLIKLFRILDNGGYDLGHFLLSKNQVEREITKELLKKKQDEM